MTVIGVGRQTRCFTYVTDAVRATVRAGVEDAAVGQIINIGNDREVTILELAQTLCRIAGKDPEKSIRFVRQEDVYGPRYEDIPRRIPDVSKMKSILRCEAKTPLEEGLRATFEYFKRP
jgi:UDP-glucose 4-epimerase